jgi:Haspin like kinase domain
MKTVVGSNWEQYHPKTNVFWIYYLVDKLESLDVPFLPQDTINGFKSRLLDKYSSAQDVMRHEITDPAGIFHNLAIVK